MDESTNTTPYPLVQRVHREEVSKSPIAQQNWGWYEYCLDIMDAYKTLLIELHTDVFHECKPHKIIAPVLYYLYHFKCLLHVVVIKGIVRVDLFTFSNTL